MQELVQQHDMNRHHGQLGGFPTELGYVMQGEVSRWIKYAIGGTASETAHQ